MQMPTEKQIKAGKDISSELVIAKCRWAFGGARVGGCKEFDLDDFEFKELVRRYIQEEIEAVTAIYLAMQQAGGGGNKPCLAQDSNVGEGGGDGKQIY